MLSKVEDLGACLSAAESLVIVCDSKPLNDGAVDTLFGLSSESLKRVVLVSKMGLTRAKANGPFGMGGGARDEVVVRLAVGKVLGREHLRKRLARQRWAAACLFANARDLGLKIGDGRGRDERADTRGSFGGAGGGNSRSMGSSDIATRNLWASVPNLLMGFAVWLMCAESPP